MVWPSAKKYPQESYLLRAGFPGDGVGIRQGFCGGMLASIFFAAALKVLFVLERAGLWECFKLTWLVLGGDPAARSHRVEQFTAL